MADFESSMKVICLESEAFEALVNRVAQQVKAEIFGNNDPFISEDKAMTIINVNSKTTMKKYRDDGRLEYHKRKGSNRIYYKRESLINFLEKKSK